MRFIIFLMGAAGYSAVEYAFRGHTHWSMALTGGACLLIFLLFTEEAGRMPMVLKALTGAFIFTVVEFFVGILVNLIYKWDVWDYSHKPFNILGQVCPEYSFKWFVLCLALLGASSVLRTLWSLLRIRREKRKNKEEGREADMEIPAFK
ncbi:MAG TPA: hypothetical protein IAC50_06490 [Candidatus Copromorpha excrementigallinarum]|uniref:Uncharacterized protein n=1 Tax=Candidatus Allocopromorpha excrementigallinarum TaxID=2840742 RepID=A0A9D1L6M0_9FIRM|nr:hypothetical protein [Candidatus Copromorpha excrementigallinarum]